MDVLLVLLSLVCMVFTYPNGAPLDACQSMMPGHSVAPQPSPAIYNIDINSTVYTLRGPPIEVRISSPSGDTFRGFLVEVRIKDSSDSTAIGSFDNFTSGAQGRMCSAMNSGVTHTINDDKKEIVFNWFPPSTISGNGNLQIVATVVKTKLILWTMIKSAGLTLGTDLTTTTTTSSSTTKTTISTLRTTTPTATTTTYKPTTTRTTTNMPTTTRTTTTMPTTTKTTPPATTTTRTTTHTPTTTKTTPPATTTTRTTTHTSTTKKTTTPAITTIRTTTHTPTTTRTTTSAAPMCSCAQIASLNASLAALEKRLKELESKWGK